MSESNEEILESLKRKLQAIIPVIDKATGLTTGDRGIPKTLLDIKLSLPTALRLIPELPEQELKSIYRQMDEFYTVATAYVADSSGYKENTSGKLKEIATQTLNIFKQISEKKEDNNLQNGTHHSVLDFLESIDKNQKETKETKEILGAISKEIMEIKQNIVEQERYISSLNNAVAGVNERIGETEKALTSDARERHIDNLCTEAETTFVEISKLMDDARIALQTTEKELGLKATHKLSVEYNTAFKKYSKLSKCWLWVSIAFGAVLFAVLVWYQAIPDNYGNNDKNETANEQKNKTEQTITKDGVSNIIKQIESIKTYENKHELADTLHDISPYATKFSIMALLLGLGTFCIKISLSYRRLAEEYNHKTILAKNLLMGGKALEGFLGDRDKMVEAFAIPSLLQILEDPLAKSRKDKSGNEATLIEKITNKLVELTEKKKG